MCELSKDYNALFELICQGHEAAAFVDYKFSCMSDEDSPFRDICRVKRAKEWDIRIGVRGTGYGHIMDFDFINGDRTEREVFIQECEVLNLAFIPPNKAL